MHGLLYTFMLQCLWLFPHRNGKKYNFQLCRPRFHFHALILHVHVEDTLIHCCSRCWDAEHLLSTYHPRRNLTADPARVPAISYPLSYTARNLKQNSFTFCWCCHQLGWLIMNDKVTAVLSRDAELLLCSVALKHQIFFFFFAPDVKTAKQVFKCASDTQEPRKLDFTDIQVKNG